MIRYAKIVSITDGKIKIKIHGDYAESNIPYYRLSDYTPAVNDTVVVDDKIHVIIGKVVV